MKKHIMIVCFLVVSILAAQYAFAESVKHKRFDDVKHKQFLEEKKAKRTHLDTKFKKDATEIDSRIAEMKTKQDEMLKGNSSKK